MKRMIGTKIILWAFVSLFILMGSSMAFAQTKTVILSTTTSTRTPDFSMS